MSYSSKFFFFQEGSWKCSSGKHRLYGKVT